MKDAAYKLIVDAARARGATFPRQADWLAFKAAIDAAVANENQPLISEPILAVIKASASQRAVSQRGIDLIHSFEQCKLTAYPDPGSRNGEPWTIGWGSTGPDIRRGTVWTQQQADERFARDIASFSAKVDALLGDTPTTQSQFDAMCSLAYNIGIGSANRAKPGGFTRSTVLRLHRAGDYKGAARAFLMWNKNDGKVMRGLTRRRMAESDLYLEGLA